MSNIQIWLRNTKHTFHSAPYSWQGSAWAPIRQQLAMEADTWIVERDFLDTFERGSPSSLWFAA